MFPIDEPVTCMLACFTLWLLGRLQGVYMSLQASIIACGSVSYGDEHGFISCEKTSISITE